MVARWLPILTIFLAACSSADPGLSDEDSTDDAKPIRADAGARDSGRAQSPGLTTAVDAAAGEGEHGIEVFDGGVPADPSAATDASVVFDAGSTPVDGGRGWSPVPPQEPRVANPQNAFTGAPGYAFQLPSQRANSRHTSEVTGKACLDCHTGTTAPKFDFAGTIYSAPLMIFGAAGAEIRIIDKDGFPATVHADVDGNFWHRADKDLALPAFSGARSANWGAIGRLNGASCNTCHTPSKKLYVY
ncbi:MAG: hypothetical protein U0169_01155 [Polyangiaceae bacterium]